MDGDLLGFINPSLTLFSADDEEAVTSSDMTSQMTSFADDVVDVSLLDDDLQLRIKTEPVEMYDDNATAMTHVGKARPLVHCCIQALAGKICHCLCIGRYRDPKHQNVVTGTKSQPRRAVDAL